MRNKKRSNQPMFEALEPRQMMTANLPSFDLASPALYQIHGAGDTQGQLSKIEIASKSFADIGSNAGFKINATGFRVADGLIYGITKDSDSLVRIGADGNHQLVGKIDGLPNGSYYSGDFGDDGLLYVRHRNEFYGINVESLQVDRVVSTVQDVSRTYDIAFNPKTNLHYSIRKAGKKAEFISIDLSRNETAGAVEVINADLKPAGTYGALFSDATGRVFAANNAGGLYEVDVATGEALFAGFSPRATSNDGAFSAAATINLPPVALDHWFSTLVGSNQESIHIPAPYDVEGESLQVTILELPSLGVVRGADGVDVEAGQTMTVEELTGLTFDASTIKQGFGNEELHFEVSDGFHTVTSTVIINLSGLSKISGSVVVLDDTEESAYEGYAYNNEIRLTGKDNWGEEIDVVQFSDINGQFEFVDVAPGTYQVQQLQPPVVIDSYVDVGELNARVENGRVVDLVVRDKPVAYNGPVFFEEAPAVVSGFTYVDSDGSGDVGVGEEGIASVTLLLSGVDNVGNEIAESTTTDSFGYYEFRNVRAGKYQIQQQQPDAYVDAVSNPGDAGGIASKNKISEINVGAGQIANGNNFGEYEKGTLAGSVFIDNDIDNAFDRGDTPVEGVTIKLTGRDIFGNEVRQSTVTDTNGDYRFDQLIAGTYELEEKQPDSLVDQRSHVGVFNDDETTLAENGVESTNRISSIQLGGGRHGRGFNFSESVNYEFTKTFEQRVVFSGTAGNDSFEFIGGDVFHVVILNGVEHVIDASKTTKVSFDGGEGVDQIRMTGSTNVEQVMIKDDLAYMWSKYFAVEAIGGEDIRLDSGGGYDRAYLYDTEHDDRLKMTQDYSRLWNDQTRYETVGYHRSYAYATAGGADRAYLYDSKYDDTVKMTSSNARIISRKFYNYARGFERVYSYSVNGGNDLAQFWDSTENRDTFEATPDSSRMFNDHFYNYSSGFNRVDAFAANGGEDDRAFLNGSESQDILVANPARAGLSGEGYKQTVHNFERVYANSNGGNDRAYLFDSKLDDRFIARPDDARLYNDEYFLKVNQFDQVDAYSSQGGNDRAYFYDSPGDDTLIALESEMRFFGDGFDNSSHGFARNYAHANAGGEDRVFFYDSDKADTVKHSLGFTRMYGEGYYVWAGGFENVTTKFASASRYDRAIVFGVVGEDTIAKTGSLAEVFYKQASHYIYDIDPHADGGDDKSDDNADISILEDLLEIIEMKD